MSVVFYGAHDWANVCAMLTDSYDRRGTLAMVAEECEKVSRINAAAFAARYPGERPEPVTKGEIIRLAMPMFNPDRRAAFLVLGLLRYNCQDSGVDIDNERDASEALAFLLSKAALRAMDLCPAEPRPAPKPAPPPPAAEDEIPF